MQSASFRYGGRFFIRLPLVGQNSAGRSRAPYLKDVDMLNPKFATALRISKLIPMVLPQYKSEAILALLAELKKAING